MWGWAAGSLHLQSRRLKNPGSQSIDFGIEPECDDSTSCEFFSFGIDLALFAKQKINLDSPFTCFEIGGLNQSGNTHATADT